MPKFRVNRRAPSQVNLSSSATDWYTPVSVTVQIALDAGTNAITFYNPKITGRELIWRFRGAMQLGGADFSYLGGVVSAVHDERDVDQTVTAFDEALQRLQAEGVV